MNDLEKRDKEELELVQSNWGLLIGFLINLFVLGYNFLDVGDNYYDGEKLSKLQLNIDKKVEYINGTVFETDKLKFSAANYDCDFWITNGTFKVAQSKSDLLNKLLKFDENDTIVVSVYNDHLQYLTDKKWNIPIIEIANKNSLLINRNQVRQFDDDSIRWDLIFSLLFGVVLIFWLKASIINK